MNEENAQVIYATSEHFLNDFTYHLRYHTMDRFTEKYRGCDILLIDDPYGASDILGCKSPYRITKALETLRNLKSKDIMSMLDRLAVLDLDSKQNSDIDDTLKLELFIVELLK